MLIEVVNRQRLVRIDSRRIEVVGRAVLAAVLKTGPWSATVAFGRDRLITQLNRRHRGVNAATDVLSFQAGGATGPNSSFVWETDYLGDVLISAETANRQAAEAGHTVDREIEELVIHGLLHLCGYDHETDRGEMNRLEVKLRRKLLD